MDIKIQLGRSPTRCQEMREKSVDPLLNKQNHRFPVSWLGLGLDSQELWKPKHVCKDPRPNHRHAAMVAQAWHVGVCVFANSHPTRPLGPRARFLSGARGCDVVDETCGGFRVRSWSSSPPQGCWRGTPCLWVPLWQRRLTPLFLDQGKRWGVIQTGVEDFPIE